MERYSINGFNITNEVLMIELNNGIVAISICKDDIIRFRFTSSDKLTDNETYTPSP